MSDIVSVVYKEIDRIENMIKRIDIYLSTAPDGSLKCHKKNGKTYYYNAYMIKDNSCEKSVKWKNDYIKKNSILASELATKHYYTILKSVLTNNLKELKHFINKYQSNKLDEIYDSLSEERKKLVTPIQLSVKEQVKLWKEEVYEQNNMFSENLRYETEQGEIVRSKSEVIIANILYKHRNDILYKYEKPLLLNVLGKEKMVYPDFTIINIHTGKVIYWEHAGLMDDAIYATEFVRKMNNYTVNGLVVGKDVIVSYETQNIPLDIGVIKNLVKQIIV